MDEAEALGVALVPFEVVEDRPVEVGADVDAVLNGAMDLGEVAAREIDALWIVATPLASVTAVPRKRGGRLISRA